MKLFNNIKIRNKLILMISFPILGLVFLSSIQVKEKFDQKINMEFIKKNVNLTSSLGNLTHAIQKERGLTIAYLSGQNSEILSTLDKQRIKVDQTINQLHENWGKEFSNTQNKQLKNKMGVLNKNLNNIRYYREKMITDKATAEAVIAYYSKIIQASFSIGDFIEKEINNKNVSNLLLTSVYLNEIKNKEGIIRALGRNFLNSDQKSFKKRLTVKKYLTEINANRETLKIFSPPAIIEKYGNYLRSAENLNLTKLQNKIGSISMTNREKIAGTHWFSIMTKKIDFLNTLREQAESSLLNLTNKNIQNAHLMLLTYGLITILLTLFSIVLIYLISSSMIKSITDLQISSRKIERGETELEIDDSHNDEIGLLARSFKKMLGRLNQISEKSTAIAQGDFLINFQTLGENDTLGIALNKMIEKLRKLNEVAKKITQGDYQLTLAVDSDKDELSKSIVTVQQIFQYWIKFHKQSQAVFL